MKRKESRRKFLKQTGVIAATGAVLASGVIPKVHAASTDTIKLGIIGCGGRGMGAARQALSANNDPNLKFWAASDVFPGKAQRAIADLKREWEEREKGNMVDVTPDRTFSEFDGYKKVIDSLDPGDVVLLTTPPAFRPLHYAYAVEKGLHVFLEKPLAVDIPGLKSLQETNRRAQEKGLKIGVGLNNRHYLRTEETVRALHAGLLGDLYSFLVYRCQPGYHAMSPRGDRTPLQHQLTRIFNFNWLTGGFIVDALIHNLDICCWANQKLPVAALGIGGRLLRRDGDDLIDNASVQYTFEDGKKMHMYTCKINGTWAGFEAVVHGSKGSARLGEGVGDPGFFEGWNQERGTRFWAPNADRNDSYQTEHDRFFKAIRDDAEWNELDHGINATFTAILGRMASETGNLITAEQAWTSTFQYASNADLDKLTLASDSPVMPDAADNYPIPYPGRATINNPYQGE